MKILDNVVMLLCMKDKGYIRSDFGKNKEYTLTGMRNRAYEASKETPMGGEFADPEYALEAVGAMLLLSQERFLDSALDLGVSIENLTQILSVLDVRLLQ